jgi:hypothetical protein
MLAGLVIFAGLVNLHWLHPFFKFLALKVEDPATTYFQNNDPLRLIKDLWPFQAFFAVPLARILILVLGARGLMRIRREAPALFIPLVIAIVFFGALAYFGSLLPWLRHLQPYRYVTAFYYMWLPAAGFGLAGLYQKYRAVRGGFAAGPLAYAGLLIAIFFMPSFRHFSRVAPLTTGLDGPSKDLIAWIEKNTGQSARILIEDIVAWEGPGPAVYGGARVVHLIPALVTRELVGGPFPNAFILHHYAGFHDGRLLREPVSNYSDEELNRVMDLYNVGWAVAWSEKSKARFRDYPAAERVRTFGYLEAFRIRRRHDFFLEGSGQVFAGWNKIELSGLSTSTGRVVVSYHWVDGLSSAPDARLEKVMIGDDPVGFIGVRDPPPELVIRLGP